jgi:tRNA (cmo5U34)-methyltransferase
MTSSSFDFDANPDFVAEYDRGSPMFIPGYAASHAMAAAVLLDRIGPAGDILVVGAGGGIEIAAFNRLCSGWRCTGVDPSQAMLDLAGSRLAREAPGSGAALVQGVSADAPAGPFDAATAFYCLMFAPDDGTRLASSCGGRPGRLLYSGCGPSE